MTLRTVGPTVLRDRDPGVGRAPQVLQYRDYRVYSCTVYTGPRSNLGRILLRALLYNPRWSRGQNHELRRTRQRTSASCISVQRAAEYCTSETERREQETACAIRRLTRLLTSPFVSPNTARSFASFPLLAHLPVAHSNTIIPDCHGASSHINHHAYVPAHSHQFLWQMAPVLTCHLQPVENNFRGVGETASSCHRLAHASISCLRFVVLRRRLATFHKGWSEQWISKPSMESESL